VSERASVRRRVRRRAPASWVRSTRARRAAAARAWKHSAVCGGEQPASELTAVAHGRGRERGSGGGWRVGASLHAPRERALRPREGPAQPRVPRPALRRAAPRRKAARERSLPSAHARSAPRQHGRGGGGGLARWSRGGPGPLREGGRRRRAQVRRGRGSNNRLFRCGAREQAAVTAAADAAAAAAGLRVGLRGQRAGQALSHAISGTLALGSGKAGGRCCNTSGHLQQQRQQQQHHHHHHHPDGWAPARGARRRARSRRAPRTPPSAPPGSPTPARGRAMRGI